MWKRKYAKLAKAFGKKHKCKGGTCDITNKHTILKWLQHWHSNRSLETVAKQDFIYAKGYTSNQERQGSTIADLSLCSFPSESLLKQQQSINKGKHKNKENG